MKISEQGLNL